MVKANTETIRNGNLWMFLRGEGAQNLGDLKEMILEGPDFKSLSLEGCGFVLVSA